jgi:transposase
MKLAIVSGKEITQKGKEKLMTRRKKEPLRTLTEEERNWLERISRALSEPAAHVARAKEILAVADGQSYTKAAQMAGRKSGDAVSHLVERFNREGIASIQPEHGGGPKVKYSAVERDRVLTEVRRTPDPEKDGTNTWSLTTLQKALRKAEDGLPEISTERIWVILQEAGFRWQKSRSWCETGQVVRKRKRGVVTVTDPDATPKKN